MKRKLRPSEESQEQVAGLVVVKKPKTCLLDLKQTCGFGLEGLFLDLQLSVISQITFPCLIALKSTSSGFYKLLDLTATSLGKNHLKDLYVKVFVLTYDLPLHYYVLGYHPLPRGTLMDSPVQSGCERSAGRDATLSFLVEYLSDPVRSPFHFSNTRVDCRFISLMDNVKDPDDLVGFFTLVEYLLPTLPCVVKQHQKVFCLCCRQSFCVDVSSPGYVPTLPYCRHCTGCLEYRQRFIKLQINHHSTSSLSISCPACYLCHDNHQPFLYCKLLHKKCNSCFRTLCQSCIERVFYLEIHDFTTCCSRRKQQVKKTLCL